MTLIPLFFLTAMLYSMVGFGGGSTYLALLVLFSFPYVAIPKVALICNIIVVTGGCYHLWRAGYLDLRRIVPLVVASVPLAYLGGRVSISKEVFLLLLGLSLAIAGVRLFFPVTNVSFLPASPAGRRRQESSMFMVLIGMCLGFLSGLVGIGGGIFLAPILYFRRWGTAQHIAAVASFFIFVNSIAGLWGQFSKSGMTVGMAWLVPLAIAVLCGGQIGSRLAANRLPALSVQRLTAVFMLWVSGRVLWGLL